MQTFSRSFVKVSASCTDGVEVQSSLLHGAINTERHSSSSIFDEDTFTFRVGPSMQSFLVHTNIVSRQSKPLHQMMKGPFRESIEKCAELPEVEPRTFENFLAYAYFVSNYSTLDDETSTQPLSAQRTSISKFIELLLEKEHKKFRCKSCHEEPELMFSKFFPRCQRCNQDEFSNLRWKAHCIIRKCPNNAEYVQGLICGSCLKTLGVLNYGGELQAGGASKLQFNPTPRLADLHSFRFDIPLRVEEIWSATRDDLAHLPLQSANLSDTAKLAVFADIYEAEQLSQTASMALYRRLTGESLDEESISTISETTSIIYNNTTTCHTRDSPSKHHILRKMVSEFIAVHRDKFVASRSFMELLAQGGELPVDVLTATIQSNNQNP